MEFGKSRGFRAGFAELLTLQWREESVDGVRLSRLRGFFIELSLGECAREGVEFFGRFLSSDFRCLGRLTLVSEGFCESGRFCWR